MAKICQLVNQVLDSGYLTAETENLLRQLFIQENRLEDLDALAVLQQAIACGIVERESCHLADTNSHDRRSREQVLVHSGREP